jgi:sugar/nucleoside kinase (ribokinase family)
VKPIVVAGELNVDLILTGMEGLPAFGTEILAGGVCQTPGSSSMICAMGLARLGETVRFVGRVGDDERGRFCTRALDDAGIDTTGVIVDPALDTGLTVALSTARDRALITYPGAIAELRGADVLSSTLAGASHLHVSSYFLQRRLQEDFIDLVARARLGGLTISLDPGYDPSARWDAGLRDLLPLVDVFLPNEVEALALTGADDLESALRELATFGPLVVVKAGARGCMTMEEDDIVEVPSFPVAAVDTTGAGDSFDAGFLHAWRAERPLRDCLCWAAACGALSTRALGGTSAQPTVDDVRALVEGCAA